MSPIGGNPGRFIAVVALMHAAVVPPPSRNEPSLTPTLPTHPFRKIPAHGGAMVSNTPFSVWQAGAGSMIELMKFDMGGSACTLGAAKVKKQAKTRE